MYEIYNTKAYILRSYTSKENDLRALFFTEDFGLIWANASGAKKDISKFRNLLQDLTELRIFLVQGKSGYRVTGGNFIDNIYFSFKEEKNKDKLFLKKIFIVKNIFNLLEKVFLHNEEDKGIFSLLEIFLNSLKRIENEKLLKEREVIFLSKLFYLWGYFDENELLEKVEENFLKLKFSEKEIKSLREKINYNLSKVAF